MNECKATNIRVEGSMDVHVKQEYDIEPTESESESDSSVCESMKNESNIHIVIPSSLFDFELPLQVQEDSELRQIWEISEKNQRIKIDLYNGIIPERYHILKKRERYRCPECSLEDWCAKFWAHLRSEEHLAKCPKDSYLLNVILNFPPKPENVEKIYAKYIPEKFIEKETSGEVTTIRYVCRKCTYKGGFMTEHPKIFMIHCRMKYHRLNYPLDTFILVLWTSLAKVNEMCFLIHKIKLNFLEYLHKLSKTTDDSIESHKLVEYRIPSKYYLEKNNDDGLKLFKCQTCDSEEFSSRLFWGHLKSSDHKLKCPEDANVTKHIQQAKTIKYDPQKEAQIALDTLYKWETPFLGLCHIIEFPGTIEVPADSLIYLCDLCLKKLYPKMLICHINSRQHVKQYLKYRYPELAKLCNKNISMEDMHRDLREKAVEYGEHIPDKITVVKELFSQQKYISGRRCGEPIFRPYIGKKDEPEPKLSTAQKTPIAKIQKRGSRKAKRAIQEAAVRAISDKYELVIPSKIAREDLAGTSSACEDIQTYQPPLKSINTHNFMIHFFELLKSIKITTEEDVMMAKYIVHILSNHIKVYTNPLQMHSICLILDSQFAQLNSSMKPFLEILQTTMLKDHNDFERAVEMVNFLKQTLQTQLAHDANDLMKCVDVNIKIERHTLS